MNVFVFISFSQRTGMEWWTPPGLEIYERTAKVSMHPTHFFALKRLGLVI